MKDNTLYQPPSDYAGVEIIARGDEPVSITKVVYEEDTCNDDNIEI